MNKIVGRTLASLALGMAMFSCESDRSVSVELPPSYYNDRVLGPLPMVSLDSLGEAAGRLEGEADHPAPETFGYDKVTGVYTHPAAAPEIEGPRPFKGS